MKKLDIGIICFIKARRVSGEFTLMGIGNTDLDFRNIGGVKNPRYKALERLNVRKGSLCISQKI